MCELQNKQLAAKEEATYELSGKNREIESTLRHRNKLFLRTWSLMLRGMK